MTLSSLPVETVRIRRITSQGESLADHIGRCTDATLLPTLVSNLLNAPCDLLIVEGPVHFAYGNNVSFGTSVHLAEQCEFLDHGPITLGDCVICGKGVRIHAEPASPVRIGSRVWIGEGVEIAPGTRIGDDVVICTGSKVSGNVPDKSAIAGDPPVPLRPAR